MENIMKVRVDSIPTAQALPTRTPKGPAAHVLDEHLTSHQGTAVSGVSCANRFSKR